MQSKNLFFDAMDTEKQLSIQEISANKEFTLRLINDLDKIFQTNYHVEDQQEGVLIRMKTSPNSNWYNSFNFSATKNGITFSCSNLGYYQCSQFKALGGLYEKYKDNGATVEESVIREGGTGHGWFHFNLKINRNGENLKETLNDIIYLMEQQKYRKRF